MKEIMLTRGLVALVDDEDYEFLNQWKWHALKNRHTFYAARHQGDKYVYMHRVLLNIDNKSIDVDHRDRNGLNNQGNNIRIATRVQNGINSRKQKNTTSEFKGVSWHKSAKKWEACIQYDGRKLYIGCFDDENEAAKQYNIKALEIYGEFALLNQVA